MEPEVGPRQPDAVGAVCSWCTTGEVLLIYVTRGKQADCRDELLLLQPRVVRRRCRERCVPSCSYDHARREGQHDATCACMRVVLCRLWVLNVWLLCTHTHTHTHECVHTNCCCCCCCCCLHRGLCVHVRGHLRSPTQLLLAARFYAPTAD